MRPKYTHCSCPVQTFFLTTLIRCGTETHWTFSISHSAFAPGLASAERIQVPQPIWACICVFMCLCQPMSLHMAACSYQHLFLPRIVEGTWRLWQLWFLNDKLMTKSQSCILSSPTLFSFVDSSLAYTSNRIGNITSTLLRLWIQMWLTAPERVTSENSKQLSKLFCFETQAFDANSSIIIFAIFIVLDLLLFIFKVEQYLIVDNVVEENSSTIPVPWLMAGWNTQL